MTAGSRFWSGDFTSGALANQVNNAIVLNGNDHLRHIRVIGNVTLVTKPTNVIGDDGAWLGIVATFPAVAPAAPSFANSALWRSGWWNRPPVTATELIEYTNTTTLPSYRYWFDIEFDYALDAGVAGAVYIGHQQIYVDANHLAPNVSYSVAAWGFTT